MFLGNTSHLAISKVVVLVVLAMYQWNWAACRQGETKSKQIRTRKSASFVKDLVILSVIVLPGSQKTAVRGNE